MDLNEFTNSVIEVAKNAGDFIRKESQNFDYQNVEEKGLNDLVSYVDVEAEKLIISELKKLFPMAGILAEESHNEDPDTDYLWIIDPLDGTTNFIHGLPAYSVSIALARHKEPVLGVVYEISRDECFSAVKDNGAYLNGNRIHVSGRDKLKDCLLATGFPVRVFDQTGDYLNIIHDFFKESHGVRRFGSAAMDLAYVACGRFDGFFEYNLSPWDVAAGVVLVKEAGGNISDFTGGDNYIFGKEIIAGNKAHGEMLNIIQRHW